MYNGKTFLPNKNMLILLHDGLLLLQIRVCKRYNNVMVIHDIKRLKFVNEIIVKLNGHLYITDTGQNNMVLAKIYVFQCILICL